MTAPEQPAVRVRRGQLVTFRAPDVILGGDYEAAGVVVAVGGDGEPVSIRPLVSYTVQVDPAGITPAAADVVAPS